MVELYGGAKQNTILGFENLCVCLGGILWANIKKVYYGCDSAATREIGFRDDLFYEYLDGKADLLDIRQEDAGECRKLFAEYAQDRESRRY